MNLRFR